MNRNLTSALFLGHDSLLTHCAQAWLDAGHAVRAVISAEPETVQWAQARGVAVFADEASLLRQPGLAFDHLFCIGNPSGVPRELLARARGLAVAFHDAPLPRYAGWHAPAWALMAQEAEHGVTWQEMTGPGAGRILCQQRFAIAPHETALSLQARCFEAGVQSFAALVDDLGRGALAPQEPAPPLQAGAYLDRQQRPATLGTLDFSQPARTLAALVAALDFGPQPNPLARAKLCLGERLLLVGSARALPASGDAAPGTVLQADEDSLRVATAEGDLALTGLSAPWGLAPGHGLRPGMVLPALGAATRAQLAARAAEIGQGELFWRKALATVAPVELPYPHKTATAQPGVRHLRRARLALPARGAASVAGFFAWLSALTGQARISALYCDRTLHAGSAGLEAWLSPWVPLTLETAPDGAPQRATEQAQARIERVRQAGPCPRDLPARLGGAPANTERWAKVGVCLDGAPPPLGAELVLTADPADQRLELLADAAVFSDTTLKAMAGHLATYLQGFEGAAALDAIALLPEDEVQGLAQLNATETPYDAGLGIHEAIAAQAARTPHSLAVSFRGQTLTYRELHAQAGALAERLRASGVRPGDVVGLCLERGPDLVAGVLAILKTGAAYLPLDPDYPHDRLLYMVEDSGAPLVLTSRTVTAKLAIPPEKVLLVRPDPAEADAGVRPAPARREPAEGRQRAAYLIYTSGSTGRPKGVVVTHQNALNFFAGLNARIPHPADGRWLAVTSLSFDISVVELLWTLTHGMAIVLHSNAQPYMSVADALLQGEVTHLQCTPSMASMLVSDAAGRRALAKLAVLMVGGEALPMKLARELRALVPGAFFNMYGPTETTVWSTACDLATLGEFVPLGQPIANTQLSIRTPGGAECPALVAGELLIGGDGVSDGYWQRPELNAERFLADAGRPGARWYRTGDLARRHPDGTLEFLGRIDHQVKIRGHRIELGEIESVLLRQEGVKDAVVVAREDAGGDWSLAAYVTPQPGRALEPAALRRGVAAKLPDIMVPRALAVLRAFPLTPNGKVDRRALPPVRQEAAGLAPTRAPSPLAAALTAAWAQALGQPGLQAHDDALALGGNFSLALQAQRLLHEACGRHVSLGELVRWPVPAALAAQLEGDSAGLDGLDGPGARSPEEAAGALSAAAPGAGVTGATDVAGGAGASAATLPPREAVGPAIARLWCELLGVRSVQPEDDFFALGGHSLTAVRLFAQIRQEFAVDLPLATLFQAPTLASFTDTVARHGQLAASRAASGAAPQAAPWSPLVRICAGRPGRQPLFCVHSAGGNVLNYKPLSAALGAHQPFYALQAQGVDGQLAPLPTIEAMAAQYIEAMRRVDPVGPYQLVGYSSGGVIAFEMARQLQQAGAGVSLLGIIDTLAPAVQGRQPSRLKKIWLMQQWSLKHVLQWRVRRRQSQRLAASYAAALDSITPGAPLSDLIIGASLYRQFYTAQKTYAPQPYPGRVVLFKGTARQAEIAHLDAGDTLGWENHVSGALRVVHIESSHVLMMEQPGVAQLARALQAELSGFQEAPAAYPAPFEPLEAYWPSNA